MFVQIYSENVVPNSLMNLFQLKYMLQMGPIPNKSDSILLLCKVQLLKYMHDNYP